jgi:hypothetical protein
MRWSQDEVDILENLYPSTPNDEIARRLGRSRYSVEMKAKRLGFEKEQPSPAPEEEGSPAPPSFELISREEALKRDKVELLRYSWSLTDLIKEEMNNPNLSDAQRHKIINSMSNMINITCTIMRHTPEEVFQEQPDLNERFLKVSYYDSPIKPRKFRFSKGKP